MLQRLMRQILSKREEVAVRIYCAKVTGFWANPNSESPLEEPSLMHCIEDAEALLSLLESHALPKARLEPVPLERFTG